MKISRTLSFIVAISISFLLYGCTNLSYYYQAVNGQIEILRKAQPINAIVADPSTDKALKDTLSRVILLRKFASRILKLPDNGSYMNYADLKRPYVVWNVYATPEFSTKLKEWCFVGAGCVEYRGFFSKEKAGHFADELRNKGYDVHVGGIRAYSTLGWFDDPVLNTFIDFSEIQLARLIFHELAHQVVYVQDDTEFNESFATMVELGGTRRWLENNGTSEQQDTFYAGQRGEITFTRLVLKYQKRLNKLFSSDVNDSEKRIDKLNIFSELLREFSKLKDTNKALSSYDQWFELQMNNALLSTISTYTKHVPKFRSLLSQQGGNMEIFYSAVRDIGKLTKSDRYSALQARRKYLSKDVSGNRIWAAQSEREFLEKE